ncbi:MAG: hypothetical protein KMY53_14180 [Desulfarculus sp.]|nr:hypothetical protein [Pseudomonadota bacterium]MBV1716635.1 hypothetical protein [Desulfarculus sp.]MBV1739311.1 hypothetical protein [Desulfarculus sp.]MBV1750934.1 hypothetical protein [Desulfarculus sp.]
MKATATTARDGPRARRTASNKSTTSNRPGRQVAGQGVALAQGQAVVVDGDVQGGQPGGQGQEQVDPGDAVPAAQKGPLAAGGEFFEGWKAEIDQHQGEGQVDGADVHRLQQDGRGQQQLEHRPPGGHHRDEASLPTHGLAQAQVRRGGGPGLGQGAIGVGAWGHLLWGSGAYLRPASL